MYGTVPTHQNANKSSNLAVACGAAAVVALVGLVSFGSQPTTLYAPSAVRPTTQVAVAPVFPAGVAARSAAAAPAVQAVMGESQEAIIYTNAQSTSTAWPAALGLSAIATAFLAIVMRKKQTPMLPIAEPVAMMATSGRPVWFPGATPAAHLTGQYPGDRGFDPLGFSKDPKSFERMRVSEVFHGRLAMLGMVGCIVPEMFFHKATWFHALDDTDLNKAGLIALQVIAPIEYWRGNGGLNWDGSDGPGDRSYPGFDPLGITTEDTKLREIKNGRLAMIGMLGLEVQSHVTGKSPLENLAAHLADPLHANIAAGSVAMFAASGTKQNRPLWFPGGWAPSYLDGKYPGDRGCDPLGLAADPKMYARYRISEVFHGRLAMLAIVGALVQEYAGRGAWYEFGTYGPKEWALFILPAFFPEMWRGQGGVTKDSMDKSYPGFDPLKLTTDYTKEAEIKNGRLAMLGMAGFEVQHHVTKASPIQNLLDHWDHPLGSNIASILMHGPSVAMFASSGHKDGVWFPNATPPAHLTGQYPGDRGFDPLCLSADPNVYARMRLSEVFHGRLAMLGLVAAVVPELLGKGPWYEAGNTHIGFITMAVAAPTEYWRGNGGFGWEKGTTDRSYPGFDPLKLTSDRTKVAEIKNGRLAMTAMLGLEMQSHVTGQSPLANLAAHLADPFNANIAHNIAMFAACGEKEL